MRFLRSYNLDLATAESQESSSSAGGSGKSSEAAGRIESEQQSADAELAQRRAVLDVLYPHRAQLEAM